MSNPIPKLQAQEEPLAPTLCEVQLSLSGTLWCPPLHSTFSGHWTLALPKLIHAVIENLTAWDLAVYHMTGWGAW